MNLTAEVQEWRRRRAERPLPLVQIDHGQVVHGAVLRTVAVLAVALLLVGTGMPTDLHPGVVLVVAGTAALWVAIRPGPVPTHGAVVIAGLLLLGSPSAPFDPAVLWLAPLAYLTVRAGWWAAHAGWRSRVETGALRRSGARDLAIGGVTVALGSAAWAIAGTGVTGLVLVGALALVALAWSLLPR